MDHHATLPPLDWVKLVNTSWLVHGGLDQSANAWLEYLAELDDGRLIPSCDAARVMCGMRDPLENPKPWFYAGLFCMATADEARRFLASHRVTKALVPAMADDGEVRLWLDRAGPETRELVSRLRVALASWHREKG